MEKEDGGRTGLERREDSHVAVSLLPLVVSKGCVGFYGSVGHLEGGELQLPCRDHTQEGGFLYDWFY